MDTFIAFRSLLQRNQIHITAIVTSSGRSSVGPDSDTIVMNMHRTGNKHRPPDNRSLPELPSDRNTAEDPNLWKVLERSSEN